MDGTLVLYISLPVPEMTEEIKVPCPLSSFIVFPSTKFSQATISPLKFTGSYPFEKNR